MTELFDVDNNPVDLADEDAVEGTGTRQVRRSTLAARLRAIYGNVTNIDPFTGILSEQHLPGSEMGELQTAIWLRQFTALRDGDRFYYGNQTAALDQILSLYGINFRRSLKDIIVANSDAEADEMNDNVFILPDASLPQTTCTVSSRMESQWNGGYLLRHNITNTGTAPINGWTVQYQMPTGQRITQLWNGVVTQNGPNVTIRNANYNASVPPGGTVNDVGFTATWDNATNARPVGITLNGRRCATA
jgi:cellulase/cellobiase CelA1